MWPKFYVFVKHLFKSHVVENYFQNELLHVSKHTPNRPRCLYKSCQLRPFLFVSSATKLKGWMCFSPNQGLFWTHKYNRHDGCNHPSKLLFRQDSSMTAKFRCREFPGWDINLMSKLSSYLNQVIKSDIINKEHMDICASWYGLPRRRKHKRNLH